MMACVGHNETTGEGHKRWNTGGLDVGVNRQVADRVMAGRGTVARMVPRRGRPARALAEQLSSPERNRESVTVRGSRITWPGSGDATHKVGGGVSDRPCTARSAVRSPNTAGSCRHTWAGLLPLVPGALLLPEQVWTAGNNEWMPE